MNVLPVLFAKAKPSVSEVGAENELKGARSLYFR